MQTYILTIPRTVHKKVLKIMIAENDCKRWVIGWETGHGGYKHYQVRLETSNPDFFGWCKINIPTAHVEKSQTWSEYERKEGYFVCSEDNKDILGVRFGHLRKNQREMLTLVDNQSDREIDVFLDPVGCHGKTWLSIHLFERGKAMLVPRYCTTAREISNFICSSYHGQKYIIIDIPRAGKIKSELYESLEEIKDGVVSDPRYYGKTRNIRGAKVVVFTNKELDKKQLSRDRWRLHGIKVDGSLSS